MALTPVEELHRYYYPIMRSTAGRLISGGVRMRLADSDAGESNDAPRSNSAENYGQFYKL